MPLVPRTRLESAQLLRLGTSIEVSPTQSIVRWAIRRRTDGGGHEPSAGMHSTGRAVHDAGGWQRPGTAATTVR